MRFSSLALVDVRQWKTFNWLRLGKEEGPFRYTDERLIGESRPRQSVPRRGQGLLLLKWLRSLRPLCQVIHHFYSRKIVYSTKNPICLGALVSRASHKIDPIL